MPQPENARVLVTGSRVGIPDRVVHGALNRVSGAYNGRVLVVHGACRSGVDAAADEWAALCGKAVEPHPATWRKANGKRDQSGGFRRNAEMVAAGAAVVLAFVGLCEKPTCPHRGLHGSHGATHTALLADEADILVVAYVVKPGSGEIVQLRTANGKPRLKAQLDELYGRVAS